MTQKTLSRSDRSQSLIHGVIEITGMRYWLLNSARASKHSPTQTEAVGDLIEAAVGAVKNH